ncbi:MBL fold metallo-hydrolase [Allosphingosinicella deserti]|uniref:MBL fold metallo-hydrolase n=1 Tax=Allosphingosinicella deserti TaxID=2116704 RepID=A0A2P7QY64_9SPHN|nr:MBL fold metallo-hydrolase [Sphingomonas deserti]PSJ42912.1 MBL fold metallo-hydrolase [Sphingomonas deserti]
MIKMLVATLGALALAGSAVGWSAPPSPPLSGHADFARFKVGRFDVFSLRDGTVPLDVHPLLKGIAHTVIDARLRAAGKPNPVPVSINAFLVDTGSRQVLIDAGAGALFGTQGGRLLHSLAAAGYSPADIDDILLTHIHADHSGGIAIGGRRLFPNAVVHVGAQDIALFLDREGDPGLESFHFEQARQTIGLYRAAGKLATFRGGTPLLPGVTALPTPGHTPGHAFYRVESDGQSIEFWGDIVHIGPVQLAHPPVTITYDVRQDLAREQRHRQFDRAVRERRLLAAPHLDFPGVGTLHRRGPGYDWLPAEALATKAGGRRGEL